MQEFLTAAQLAARIGVAERTIARWTARGVLPRGQLIGGRRFWLATQIEAWLQRHMASAEEPAAEQA